MIAARGTSSVRCLAGAGIVGSHFDKFLQYVIAPVILLDHAGDGQGGLGSFILSNLECTASGCFVASHSVLDRLDGNEGDRVLTLFHSFFRQFGKRLIFIWTAAHGKRSLQLCIVGNRLVWIAKGRFSTRTGHKPGQDAAGDAGKQRVIRLHDAERHRNKKETSRRSKNGRCHLKQMRDDVRINAQ